MQSERVSDLRRDWQVRVAAMVWLEKRRERTGSAVHGWRELVGGFPLGADWVKLKHPQMGIHRPPEHCIYPISITTSLSDPYGDVLQAAGRELRYRFKGRVASGASGGLGPRDRRGQLTQTDNASNRGLRSLMRLGWPLIHFRAVASGEYLAVAPVVILNEDPVTQTFGVAMGAELGVYAGLAQDLVASGAALPAPWALDLDAYRGGAALRVAEGVFRHRILDAYGRRCAACSVSAPPLLDAVRIVGCWTASDSRALPLAGGYHVRNGLSLCKLHHAAYDQRYLGITPDYRVELRGDIAAAAGVGGTRTQARLHLPSRDEQRPSPHLLEVRYEEFRAGVRHPK